MEKSKTYKNVQFSVEVLLQAFNLLGGMEDEKVFQFLTVDVDDAILTHDRIHEFLADYRKYRDYARIAYWESKSRRLDVIRYPDHTKINISAPTRAAIEEISSVFETHLASSLLPTPAESAKKPDPPVVFIVTVRAINGSSSRAISKINTISMSRRLRQALAQVTRFEISWRTLLQPVRWLSWS